MTSEQLLRTWENDLKSAGFIFSENPFNKTIQANFSGVRIMMEEDTLDGRSALYAGCYQFLSLRKKVKGER